MAAKKGKKKINNTDGIPEKHIFFAKSNLSLI